MVAESTYLAALEKSTKIEVKDWHAQATLSIEPTARIPENAAARVGVNTLLGSAYVELVQPADARGTMKSGGHIPLERGKAYPSTEQVLSAASLALNGGGLEQLATITTELNKVLGGNDHAVASLLPRLDSFVGALDAQREDILSAVRDVERLSKRFASDRTTITSALDEVGPALEVLSRSRPRLINALKELTRLSSVATPLVEEVEDDLLADLRDLTPALKALTAAGDSAVSALGFAITFPFAPETVQNACRADYCNLFLTVELTNDAILNGFIRPDGSIGVPGLPGLPDLGGVLKNVTGGLLGTLNSLVKAPPSRTTRNPGPLAAGLGLNQTIQDLLDGLAGGKR